jgi:spermidine/putrescine-binding protein
MSKKVVLNVVSFGFEYQQDLVKYWVKPAAEKCGFDLVEYPPDFAGVRTPEFAGWNWHNLFEKIKKGENDWDLVQVEDHTVHWPEALGYKNIFASFPNRVLNGVPAYLQNPKAVPAAQGGYILGWHRDKVPVGVVPTWTDFFDTEKIPGKRGVRDFPTQTIELALLSMGRDVKEVFYNENLSKEQIEEQVRDAIHLLEENYDHIEWWVGGLQSDRQLVEGVVVMSSLWNRRIMTANVDLCPDAAPEDLIIQSNPKTAITICDYFVIPMGTGKEEAANKLLECMYNDEDAVKGAAVWSTLQQNVVPSQQVTFKDEFARQQLEMGSWKNPDALLYADTRFWGKHFGWIGEIWKDWRIQFGGMSPGSFVASKAPPPRAAREREWLIKKGGSD